MFNKCITIILIRIFLILKNLLFLAPLLFNPQKISMNSKHRQRREAKCLKLLNITIK